MTKLPKGRLVNHSDNIILSSLESIEPNLDHRQMIKFSYKERNTQKVTTIVLMNPSSASIEMADHTIRRVQDVVFKLFDDISEVRDISANI